MTEFPDLVRAALAAIPHDATCELVELGPAQLARCCDCSREERIAPLVAAAIEEAHKAALDETDADAAALRALQGGTTSDPERQRTQWRVRALSSDRLQALAKEATEMPLNADCGAWQDLVFRFVGAVAEWAR